MSEFLWASTACFHNKYGFAALRSAEKDYMEIVREGTLVFDAVINYLFVLGKKEALYCKSVCRDMLSSGQRGRTWFMTRAAQSSLLGEPQGKGTQSDTD